MPSSIQLPPPRAGSRQSPLRVKRVLFGLDAACFVDLARKELPSFGDVDVVLDDTSR
jgi:hypothetical protein